MSRQTVIDSELVEIINSELSKHEECKNCRISGIMSAEEDETGCNWSEPVIRCSGTPAEVCLPIASDIINRARKEFNLK